MRDKERRKRTQDREQRDQLRVWEKPTTTSRSGRSAQLKDLLAGDGDGAEESVGAGRKEEGGGNQRCSFSSRHLLV